MATSTRSAFYPVAAMSILVLAAFANATLYIHWAGNPMLSSDNWLFVDTFLKHAYQGQLDVGDFLVKRAGMDHGQPLNKLLMLLNARWFGLDFVVESLFGLVFAIAGFLVLFRMVQRDAAPPMSPSFCLGMAALAAVHVSLNSSMVFTFSLVTLGYADFFLVVAVMYAAWTGFNGGSLVWFALAMLVMGVAADQTGLLGGAAVAGALSWAALRVGRARRLLVMLAILVAALLASQAIYAAFGDIRGSTLAVFNVPATERLHGLRLQLGDAWRWITVPAASGVAYALPLQYFFGQGWASAQALLGLVVAVAHGWFWWSARKAPAGAAAFAAVCLMLLFYAYVAGLLYGRVFLRGADYLNQPKYIALYQVGIMALILMGLARSPSGRPRWTFASACAVLLAVQLPLSLHAWNEARYFPAYYRQMAAQYGTVARNPDAPPPECVAVLTLCGLTQAQRIDTIAMLKRHRLNLFSDRFARAHPRLAEAAGTLEGSPGR